MKQYQICYENSADFGQRLAEIRRALGAMAHGSITFFISWCRDVHSDLDAAVGVIERYFPDAVYCGVEASGSIASGEIAYGVVVNCFILEQDSSRTELVWVEQGTEIASLSDLWDYCNSKPSLRAVEMLPSIAYLDTLKINGNIPEISPDVLIFGGASVNYDDPTFMADIVAKGHPRTKNGMAVLLYIGEELNFISCDILGWKGLGRYMKVTRSDGKVIREIDGTPAYSIYENYLNLSIEDRDPMVFPLIVNEDGRSFIRTPQVINEDKSMRMFVDVPEDTMVRIAYGDKNTILREVNEMAKVVAAFRPDGIMALSCAARRYFWGDDEISKETKAFEEFTSSYGFFTGGEILRVGGKLKILNQTLVIIALREFAVENDYVPSFSPPSEFDKSIVSRLAHFTWKVSEEQEKIRNQLARDKMELRESMEIIKGLASEYLALYYVNLKERIFRPYSVDETRLADTKKLLAESRDPFELVRRFANSPAVHPDDRALFANFTPDSIKRMLSDRKKITIRFRRDYGSGYLWSIVDVVKYDAVNEEANSFVIGYAERDKEIKLELERQRLMEEALAEKKANKAKSYFFSMVSHDIRTPLNAIIGYAELLKLGIASEEERKQAIDSVLVSGHILLDLINDVLDLSKIDAGKMEIVPEPVDITRLLNEVSNAFRATIGKKPVEIRTVLRPMPWLKLDPHRVRQILFNLVGNAVKFTESGFVEIRAEYSDGSFRVEVQDTGCGISEEDQMKIAQPYVQFGSAKSRGRGTGLGLAICQNLVFMMDGEIELMSAPGVGTTFYVRIPCEEEDEAAFQERFSATQRIRFVVSHKTRTYRHVLVVDDVPMNRMVLKTMLTRFGLSNVDVAGNGREAIEKLRASNDYDLVLTDMWMPEMDGEALVKAIRANPRWNSMSVYAVTADVEAQKDITSMGFTGILLKPVTLEKLRNMLV